MFRKLTERISAAANAVMGSDEQGVEALVQMGFSNIDARNALQATNGNVDQAAELLLASGSTQMDTSAARSDPSPPSALRENQTTNNHDNDNALNIALQESLQTEEARQLEAARMASKATATTTNTGTTRSAATSRAGQAAVLRAAGNGSPFPPLTPANGVQVCAHHPTVKMPERMSRKPKEEQVLRCADRLKSFPRAVDTLYIALTAIQKDPSNDKYRKVDKTNAGYQRSLANAPGAEDFLRAMSFVARGTDTLVLPLDQVDLALLYLGISALETTRQTPEYIEAKRKLQFEKEVKALLSQGDSNEAEAIKRANHMSKCPTEPSEGRGALMQVKIADDTLRRRFDGDDTLQDVLNWLGGHSSAIPEKVMSREWSLVDLNHFPLAPIDCEDDCNKTLQYIGCWPSGRLEVLPSAEGWQARKSLHERPGSSRGLGAAPR